MQPSRPNNWIVPTTNGPGTLIPAFQNIQIGNLPEAPNLFNSYGPPQFVLQPATNLSNYRITPATPQIMPVNSQPQIIQYPLGEQVFNKFMSFFPSIGDASEKKSIRETLEQMNPESRNVKMRWVISNLIDKGCHPEQIIQILTMLSPLSIQVVDQFFSVVKILDIPKEEYEHLIKPEYRISLEIKNKQQFDHIILHYFKELKISGNSNPKSNTERAEKKLLSESEKYTYVNHMWHCDSINKYKIQLVASFLNAFQSGVHLDQMKQTAELVRKLIRDNCFSVFPHAFTILTKEKENMFEFAKQVQKLFFQGSFLTKFMSRIEDNRIVLPHVEYRCDFGVYHQFSQITLQMEKALNSLSSTPQVDRNEIINYLSQKLDPANRNHFSHIDQLFKIFNLVEPDNDEQFWLELKGSNKNFIDALNEIGKKYQIT